MSILYTHHIATSQWGWHREQTNWMRLNAVGDIWTSKIKVEKMTNEVMIPIGSSSMTLVKLVNEPG